jgi:hypothetical protein
MYEKPTVERFGVFRELTKWGLSGDSDGGAVFGIGSPGCSTFGKKVGCPDGGGSRS